MYVAVVSRQPWWLILVTKDKWLIWKMYKNLKCSLWWYIGRDNGRKCWTDICRLQRLRAEPSFKFKSAKKSEYVFVTFWIRFSELMFILSSVQFKMVSMHSEKPVCTPPHLSKVFPVLLLKQSILRKSLVYYWTRTNVLGLLLD